MSHNIPESANLRSVLHVYNFNIGDEAQRAEYHALRDKLTAMGLECFESHGGGSHYCPQLAGPVVLETSSLFNNQWNTAADATSKGHRVFDWAQDYNSDMGAPRYIKRGHWIEQTAEMREIRRNTVACGYCGKQETAQKGYVFCPHCLDSEYLKESDLLLTRMVPVEDGRRDRQPLTKAEHAHLLPLYRDAQLHGSTERGRARIAKARADIEKDYLSAIAGAKSKRDGARWIIERFPQLLDNWIYYSHTGKHCFGWRKPLEGAVLSALLDAIPEFPFPYEIKTADGRNLEAA